MASRAGAVGAAAIAIGLLCAPMAMAGPRPGERYDGLSATGQRVYLSVRADGTPPGALCARRPDALHRRPAAHPGPGPPRRAAGRDRRRRQLLPPVPRRSRRLRPGPGKPEALLLRHLRRRRRHRHRHDRGDLPARGASTARAGRSPSPSIATARRARPGATRSWPPARTGRGDAASTPGSGRWRPAASCSAAAIRYRAPCRAGGALTSGRTFLNYPLTERGALRVTGRANFRIPSDRVMVRSRFRLTLRFLGGTRVRGAWRVRAVVFRGGRAIDSCRMNRSFRGSFRSGPA